MDILSVRIKTNVNHGAWSLCSHPQIRQSPLSPFFPFNHNMLSCESGQLLSRDIMTVTGERALGRRWCFLWSWEFCITWAEGAGWAWSQVWVCPPWREGGWEHWAGLGRLDSAFLLFQDGCQMVLKWFFWKCKKCQLKGRRLSNLPPKHNLSSCFGNGKRGNVPTVWPPRGACSLPFIYWWSSSAHSGPHKLS